MSRRGVPFAALGVLLIGVLASGGDPSVPRLAVR
jgi:hypothetical protein